MNLRAKLTLAFALVAVAAVGLTSLLTLLAAQGTQNRLAEMMLTHMRAVGSAGTANVDMGGMTGLPTMSDILGDSGRAEIAGLRTTALISALVAGALAIAAAAFISSRLTAPLGALADATDRLEKGERGMRIKAMGGDELGRVTEGFNRLVAGLEHQETLRREMVADVAHELRTPLSVLRSKLEAMQDGLLEPDQAKLAVLHDETMLLGRLVEDLRTLSLAEGGGLDLRLEQTRIELLLERTRDAFTSRATDAGVHLRLESVPDNLTARLDADRITQVLHNLVENAIRHAGKGQIEIGAASEPGGVRVWVRDHGLGLSDAATEKVFERFYRADPSRSRATGGSGLGLAIAKAIVQAHGGRLEVSNHPQGGAVFTLHLPSTLELK